MKKTYFERAIFLSWYCSKRDCAFCYLSSKKTNQDPIKDRRSQASVLAEAIICKACKWKIEFLSSGCDSFSDLELFEIIKNIYEITKQKQWLNIGFLNKKQLELFKPYITGVCGAVECINPKLREKLCPSKPLWQIEKMFSYCNELNLKKAITIIIGLGEKIGDFETLKEFINKHKIDRITFYRLKPQKATIFENKEGPKTEYYVEWIKKTRKEFPHMEIIAGSWLTHLDEISLLLKAGADSITKFPSIRKFNTIYAKRIEEECKKANRILVSSLTKKPEINIKNEIEKLGINEKLKKEVEKALAKYIKKMEKIKE